MNSIFLIHNYFEHNVRQLVQLHNLRVVALLPIEYGFGHLSEVTHAQCMGHDYVKQSQSSISKYHIR